MYYNLGHSLSMPNVYNCANPLVNEDLPHQSWRLFDHASPHWFVWFGEEDAQDQFWHYH